MTQNLLDLYRASSAWAGEKVAAVSDLDASTPCTEWSVRDLVNHMLETQRYFVASGRGQQVSPPGKTPPDIVGADPSADWRAARDDVIEVFGQDGMIEKTGPAIGIAFADSLLHGWDLAKATGQDATMPEGLPDAAYSFIHGRFTDEQRVGVFAPEIAVGDDATPQQRLLAYTGRRPD